MTQAYDKYELDNSDGATFRQNLNKVLEAAVTQNSGPNPPNTTNTTYAYQTWVDTDALGGSGTVVKIRDAASAGTWYSLYKTDANGQPTGAVATGSYSISTNDTGGTGGTTAIFVDTSQNVGIGTASPTYGLLDVRTTLASTSYGADVARFNNVDPGGGAAQTTFISIGTAYTDDHEGVVRIGAAREGTSNKASIVFHTSDTTSTSSEKARLDSSGRLLVGTSIWSNTSRAVFSGNSSDNLETYVDFNRGTAATATNSYIGLLNFRNGGSDTCASIHCQTDAACASGDSPGRLVFSTTADGASSPTERMRIGENGTFRTFSDSDAVFTIRNGGSASGDSSLIVYKNATSVLTGSAAFLVRQDGDCENVNNSYGPYVSDERLKQDIVDIGSQWDDIKGIRLTKFRFKNDPDGQLQLGPIAQELEEVSPGLITRRPASEEEVADPSNELVDGDEVLSFKASILYMKAVGALQEAMERIETLEAKVAALEGA